MARSDIRKFVTLVGLTFAVLAVNTTDVIAECMPEKILSSDQLYDPRAWIFMFTSSIAPSIASTQVSAQESQTSGCTSKSSAYETDKLEFIAYNYDNIAQNIAAGGGEYLASLASLFNCPQIEFANLLQPRFEHLFPSIHQDAATLLASLEAEILLDQSLASACEFARG